MKVHTKKFSTIIILSLLAFVMTSSICSAQAGSRSGKSEIYGILQTLGGWSDKESGTILGETVSLEYGLDDAFIYGVGIGYNIDDHFNLNTDFAFGTQDVFAEFEAVGIVVKGKESATVFLWNVNLDYNILAEPLTPLVSAGIGYATYSGSGATGSDFTYNIGGGGRWDISDNFFVKATYRMTWFEDFDQDGIFVGIGYMF